MDTVTPELRPAQKVRGHHLLAGLLGAVLAGAVGVVAVGMTDSWWAAGIALVAAILLPIVLDESARAPAAPRPVTTAEPSRRSLADRLHALADRLER